MDNHTYWRLNITGNNGGGYILIAEITMAATVGGADQCEGGTPTANGTFSTFTPSKAVDNSSATNSAWSVAGTSGWWKYQFASPVKVLEYSIQAGKSAQVSHAPSSWTLEWSNDNTNWTVVDTRTEQTGWAVDQIRTFQVTDNSLPNNFLIFM